MSDMSQGTGWWIASDGKWYPPHLHPSVRVDPPASGDATTSNPTTNPSHESEVATSATAGSETPWRPLGQSTASEVPSAAHDETQSSPHDGEGQTSPPRYAASGSAGPGSAGGPNGYDGQYAAGSSFAPTGPGADAPAGPEPKKRTRTPVTVGLSVLVVLLLIAGASVLFGGSKSASAEVISAVNSTLGDKTAHVTMSESIISAGTTVTGKGTGAMDFTHAALQMQMTINADGQQVPIDADYLGGVIYEKIPGLGQIAPGKSWISIDLSALQKSVKDQNAQGLGTNPAAMLQMLAQQGNTVVALGPSTLDGTAVNGYAVTINSDKITQELKKADLPSWMQKSLTGLKTKNYNMKVYIDNNNLLRAFQFQISESTTAAGNLNISETVAFSDYGTPVSVSAPPAGQTMSFQQFIAAEGSQAPSGS